jgi:plasmid stabilization system protein ParE
VARIVLSARAVDDLDRILAHLIEHGVDDAGERVADIVAALDVLGRNPMIGRPAEHGLRELVIGRGTRGYVALYAYVVESETVRVAAVPGQREAGY